MGNVSTIEYDNEIYSIANIEDMDLLLDFYIGDRWFNIKLTNSYELKLYEIVKKKELMDIKYFDIEYPFQNNALKLYHQLIETEHTEIYETIIIRKMLKSDLRCTEFSDIQSQINILNNAINTNVCSNNESIQKYLAILYFCNVNAI
jgi:hypothetical protein